MLHKIQNSISLKIRIFFFFLGTILLLAGVYFFTMTRFITRSFHEQLNNNYEDILANTCDSMEKLLWDLTLTSQQLLDSDTLQTNLITYLYPEPRLAKADAYKRFTNELYSLTLPNTSVGLISFYDTDNQIPLYSNLTITDTLCEQPLLHESFNARFRFLGPTNSQCCLIGSPVLILNRQTSLPNGQSITLSLETGMYSLSNLFYNAQCKSAYLAFFNYQGELIFTTFPQDWDASGIMQEIRAGSNSDFHSFSKQVSQGWTAYIIVPNTIYTADYRLALQDFILATFLVIGIILFIVTGFWKSIYQPLQLFERQLNLLLTDEVPAIQFHSSIPEYDHLMNRIILLQAQIQELIQQKLSREKMHSQMQLETLRAQISPHFLLNTLNSLHWMAIMEQQTDLDRVVQSLSHLLSYNLDKEDYTTLDKELSALQEYVRLQTIRYDFDFQIHTPDELSRSNYPCPKFILQPLVENALIHGYRPNMNITITIKIDTQITIEVRDTGTGIDLETLKTLKTAVYADSNDIGIGLRYVIQSLDSFSGGASNFSIQSIPGTGTCILLQMPKIKGDGYHAESNNH